MARRKRRMQRGRLDLSAAVCTKMAIYYLLCWRWLSGANWAHHPLFTSVLTEGWHETFFKRGAVLSSVRNSDCGCQFYADPANVLRTGYERTVAEILAGEENASNLRNMDDRLFMEEYVSLEKNPLVRWFLDPVIPCRSQKELTGDENTFCGQE